VQLDSAKQWLEDIRQRRNIAVEKATKAKTNSKIARAAAAEKQIANIFKKLERKERTIQDELESYENELNKARALFWELSGGEVMYPKTETQSGRSTDNPQSGSEDAAREGDRGNSETGAD
jgi:ABC-type phosphate transport system auxiliary subunit